MELSISNIAWPVELDPQVASLLSSLGINKIDIAPSKYFDLTKTYDDETVQSVKTFWSDYGISIYGMQSLLYQCEANLFGSEKDRLTLIDRLTGVFSIGMNLGVTRYTFGCPVNRKKGNLADDEANDIARTFFKEIGDLVKGFGGVLCLEPVPEDYGCDFLTTTQQCVDFVRELSHPNVKVQLDTGALATNGEEFPKDLFLFPELLGHIHASEPKLAPLGSNNSGLYSYSREISDFPKSPVVTIEMLTTDGKSLQSIKSSVDIAQNYFRGKHVPNYKNYTFTDIKKSYCVVIPVINEGNRLHEQLLRMQKLDIHNIADIIIVDGGSTDGSVEESLLVEYQVNTLLVKSDNGGLSAQLRCAYDFALRRNYDGVITIDGNNKDDPSVIPEFIAELEAGTDFVQASRFIADGVGVNTPKVRDLAIRYIHAPMLSFASGFKWTDTTQGFRAYSSTLLKDSELAIFREEFDSYELLAYLSYRAPMLDFVCKEVATGRVYPDGIVPTKISAFSGNIKLMVVLLKTCLGYYNTKT